MQGVGFRPLVYRRATELGLAGYVANTADGLVVEIEGSEATVGRFVRDFHDELPPHARIESLDVGVVPAAGGAGFHIAPSVIAGAFSTAVPVDLATCDECLAEVFDASNRRFRYAFTSCVNCGPRYSIQHAAPYDRCRTAMAPFAMCEQCRAEYAEPGNRRFHAQINACPRCGPDLTWLNAAGAAEGSGQDALQSALTALRAGQIVALKGLGGYQLLADARNEDAVARLRTRKQRPHKPFALMVSSVAAARLLSAVDATDAGLLRGAEAPIVLLRRHQPCTADVAPSVAAQSPWLGLMLPCTPLHHLLARDAGFALVATSGNVAGEPLLYDDEAPARLQGIADGFLVHDRAIVQPVDDSVIRVACGRPLLLRRARGYAPASVPVPGIAPGIVGTGGHLKNTVAISLAGRVLVGPHVGDLDSVRGRQAHQRSLAHLAGLAGAPRIAVLARDMHPDYATDDAGEEPVQRRVAVQHHVAHVTACMAEHGLSGPVLGVAWDGAGFGPDATLWGGEFLLMNGPLHRRIAHFRQFRLPGGLTALREPWRAALGALFAALGASALTPRHLPYLGRLPVNDRGVVIKALEQKVNAPLTSSAGRLFDVAAALLDLCPVSSFEGQAAATLEWAADGRPAGTGYDFPVEFLAGAAAPPAVIDFRAALEALLGDRDAGIPKGEVARRWHDGLAGAVLAVARAAGVTQVALAGGCFQNRLLLERVVELLQAAGFRAYWPQRLPPNDGGLALGQVVWAARAAAELA